MTINPFYDATSTCLSSLNDHDYQIARSHWMMFGGYSFCRKLGRKWTVEGFGISHPTFFKTKDAAERFVSDAFCAEARWRRSQQWEAENQVAA